MDLGPIFRYLLSFAFLMGFYPICAQAQDNFGSTKELHSKKLFVETKGRNLPSPHRNDIAEHITRTISRRSIVSKPVEETKLPSSPHPNNIEEHPIKISRKTINAPSPVDSEAMKNLKALFGKCSLSESNCDPTYRYRTFSGNCNNLKRPETGASLTEMTRLVSAEYDDGKESPRQKSIFRNIPLPNPRLVSARIHERLSSSDNQFSLMMMQWGQFIDHDFAHTPQYKGPNNTMLKCGDCESAFFHLACFPILVPKEDKFFPRDTGRRCMRFVRSLPSQQSSGPRQQLNLVTHFLDGSMVYGSDICHAEAIRDPGFKLRMTKNPISHPGSPKKDLLPLTSGKPECRAKDKMCFEVGLGFSKRGIF